MSRTVSRARRRDKCLRQPVSDVSPCGGNLAVLDRQAPPRSVPAAPTRLSLASIAAAGSSARAARSSLRSVTRTENDSRARCGGSRRRGGTNRRLGRFLRVSGRAGQQRDHRDQPDQSADRDHGRRLSRRDARGAGHKALISLLLRHAVALFNLPCGEVLGARCREMPRLPPPALFTRRLPHRRSRAPTGDGLHRQFRERRSAPSASRRQSAKLDALREVLVAASLIGFRLRRGDGGEALRDAQPLGRARSCRPRRAHRRGVPGAHRAEWTLSR